jgi:hypothetical protein
MATDDVTNLDAAHVPDKTAVDTITGQWKFTKPVATPGGANFTANGEMETWLAGAAVAPTDWSVVGAGATIARESAGANVKQGTYSAALTRVGTDCYLMQDVTVKAGPVGLWQSQPVVLGWWVKASVATRARISVWDGSVNTFSAYHTGGGAYEFLTVALTLGAGITALQIRLHVDTGNTTAYFDFGVFTLGSGISGAMPSSLATTPSSVAPTDTPIPGQASNLWIRTHDNLLTTRKTTVRLNADEIVLKDNAGGVFRISTWNQQADVTAAGANGLDTGSEAAYAWYSIHAIRKSADGTKGALLHRMPYYVVNTNYATGEDGSHMLRRATAPLNQKLAQGFQIGVAATLPFITLKLQRGGAVAVGTKIWATIESDAAGKPSGTVLATSDEIEASRISSVAGTPGTGHYVVFVFRTPPSLTASTQYHIVLQGDYAISDTVNIMWRADTTAATYANGAKAFYDGAIWTTDSDDDFIFSVYVDQGTATLTLPSGYDQYSPPLGYVFNNLSGDFDRFEQVGKVRRTHLPGAAKITRAASAVAGADPVGIETMVPPGSFLVQFSCGSNVVDYAAFGHISAVDADSTPVATKDGAELVYTAIASTVVATVTSPMVMAEFQIVLIDCGNIFNLYNAVVHLP